MIAVLRGASLAVALVVLAAGAGRAAEQTDPFLGDWQGEWAKEAKVRPGAIVAQVIPRGGGRYQINLLPEFNRRAPPYAVVQATAEGGGARFDQDGWTGRIDGDRFTGSGPMKGKQAAFEMTKVTRLSPRLGAAAPEGAIVLFDGTDFRHWEMLGRGATAGKVTWTIAGGVIRVVPALVGHKIGPSLATKRAFTDFRLHLEFRLPLMPEATGQMRANSGVIIEDYQFHEVQVLDTYGLPGYFNECGGIYRVAPPKVNMCAPPRQWQSYDITFHAARFDKDGNRTAPARITVSHNGTLIHNGHELPEGQNAARARRERPESRKVGRIKLQDHGYPVEYRNIWLVDLSQAQP